MSASYTRAIAASRKYKRKKVYSYEKIRVTKTRKKEKLIIINLYTSHTYEVPQGIIRAELFARCLHESCNAVCVVNV